MYKLTYKGQLVDGFDTEQVVGNLAQLLNLKPKAVRLAFLSDRPSVIKMLDSASEVERWCAAFQEAGVYLDVAGVDASHAESIADGQGWWPRRPGAIHTDQTHQPPTSPSTCMPSGVAAMRASVGAPVASPPVHTASGGGRTHASTP